HADQTVIGVLAHPDLAVVIGLVGVEMFHQTNARRPFVLTQAVERGRRRRRRRNVGRPLCGNQQEEVFRGGVSLEIRRTNVSQKLLCPSYVDAAYINRVKSSVDLSVIVGLRIEVQPNIADVAPSY